MVFIKRRNLFVQILLMFLTLGLYSFYWFYQTAKELKHIANDEKASPALWIALIFIPFAGIYSQYKYCELFSKVSLDKLNKWLIFVLSCVFCPAVWFIVQTDLNKIAERENSPNIL